MSSLASSNQFDHRHTELLKASSAGKEEVVFSLIDGELWSTQTDRDALRQSLQRVAGRGNARLAQYLLGKGAEVNVRRDSETSALYQAARAGHNKVVEMLLRHGAVTEWRDKDGRTALWTPVMRGFTDTVQLLLKGRANINARDKEGRTILIHLAAEKPGRWMQDKKLEMVHLLLKNGADIEAKDYTRRTALSWAAATGKAELCELLLEGKSGKKADIRAHNSKQQTALHWACENNHEETVKVLLEHNADPAARSDGNWTPLHMAAQRGHTKVVKLLLEQGDRTPVNSQLTNGMTALHWAAFRGHKEVVELLLQRPDTKLWLKDTYDRTAILCAAENKHRDIVTRLSPGMTGDRLSQIEMEASKRFQATVVDFGEFRDGKKQLVFKDHSVYELLHGWDAEKNKPLVATHVKSVRHQPAFRWIHLPANNIAWVETLLAKAFVEGGCKDIEDYKALEKCFNQEHRGPEAHAHFMRPWSQRYAISPFRAEKPIDPPPEIIVGSERGDGQLEQSAATLVITPAEGDAELSPISTPKRPPPSPPGTETAGSGRKKPKKVRETIEDRHGKTQKRRNGPQNDGQSKRQKAAEANKAPSGAPKNAPSTPGANGKIVLFMPFLHYESDGKRRRMAEAVQLARRHDADLESIPAKACADDLLIKAYLNHEPPLHVRRTLDQFFYHSIDTSERDVDQVVYRHFKRNLKDKEPMVFMVDQLWMWILGKELIVTSFPQRWDQPANEDPLNVLLGIIEDMNAKTRPPVGSVYDLAMLITGRCCGVFDRHRQGSEVYQFLDMFEIAIGQITNREARLFERFKLASAATSMYLMDVNSVRESRRFPEISPSRRSCWLKSRISKTSSRY
ncbi:hypothetical protein, variant [Verruconis gallopava]|uniref:Uncharacterized protein n=1 Tax=Verruconis gallopava TaxID=253628 RepID=A0A0D1YPK4_9PEZI|nr:hypothetical protein, variant [Verruconis gallopava]KIW02552.1 hypothetical protein, variant [Verruconis gallopava]